MTKTSVTITFAFIMLIVAVCWPNSDQETNIRLFCSNGRVFIEFQEKYNTWGTMWLNDDGLPVKCGKEMTTYKDMT